MRTAPYLVFGGLIIGFFLLVFTPGFQNFFRSKKDVTVLLASETEAGVVEEVPRDLQIVSILPRDAIPAILEPSFVSAEKANESLRSSNQVLGVSINGEHRAYPTGFLSSHEIVNDVVGGTPVAVTW